MQFSGHSPVYRIGGDEFVAILTDEDYKAKLQRLSDLKEAFKSSYENRDLDPWLRFSAAMGMAEYTSDDNSVELVFKRADKAILPGTGNLEDHLSLPSAFVSLIPAFTSRRRLP